MDKNIDCLFIGHNDVTFEDYEMLVSMLGKDSGTYRDLNLNFIRCDKKPYSLPDIYNQLAQPEKPLGISDIFSPAIAYLGTYIKRAGFTFDFVNSFQDEKDRLKELLTTRNILSIAVITTLYVSPYPVSEIISFIKKHNKTAKIIIGGPFIFNQSFIGLSTGFFKSIGADYFITSTQGESTLTKVLTALKTNSSLGRIENLSFQKNGKWVANPTISENNRLEDNIPHWDLFSNRIGKFASVRTVIACPFSCSFCGFHVRQGTYQAVDVTFVEEELNAIEALGTVTSLSFIDDTFNYPPERFKKILRMMIRNRYSFKWNCQFRCQFADKEMVELMKESQCEGVFLGIESANPKVLSNMNKKAAAGDYKRGLALLNEFAIPSHANFIIGFPGETHETVRDNIDFINDTCPTFFRAQVWYCDPATPIYRDKQKYGISGTGFEWSHATMNAREAFDIVDEIFLEKMNALWMPQYNFEINGAYGMMHRGMSLEQVEKFLTAFNRGILHKLRHPKNPDVSEDLLQEMKEQVRIDQR